MVRPDGASPPIAPASRRNTKILALVAAALVALAIGWPGAGRRGVTSEEVQPYLARHPFVLGVDGPALPPDEPNAPARPRWVATAQWPVLSWDGERRQWPVFIRGHQSALGSYFGLLLGPVLGGGIAGVQRSSVLLTLLLLPSTLLLALRSWAFRRGDVRWAYAAPLLLALSFGTAFIGRTGYGFEIASRVMMLATLAVAAPLAPLSTRRAIAVGVLAAIAVVCRATIAVSLAPALAILLAHPARSATWARRAIVPAVMGGLPLVLVAVVSASIHFHADTAPLAGFPLHALADRARAAPAHLFTQLAWVGDPQSVLGFARGAPFSRGALVLCAALGAVPTIAACVRWWRGVAGDGERMFVAALLGNVVFGALLYEDAGQFQLAMALDPLVAIALCEQLAAVAEGRSVAFLRPASGAVALLLLAVGVRAQSVVRGLSLDDRGSNPLFSARTQRGAVDLARELRIRGPELMTTTYNQAGVLEAWTDGALRPVHAWMFLRGKDRVTAFDALLRTWRPRFVLLGEGSAAYEGGFTRNEENGPALEQAATRVGCRRGRSWPLPTESGAPGWRLVELTCDQ